MADQSVFERKTGMCKRLFAVLGVLFLGGMGEVLGGEDLCEEALAALKTAAGYFHSISTNGGYCGIYSLDLTRRYGEATFEEAKDTEIWVQPPGTPTVGQCYLRAWRVTGDEFYLEAARDAARALAWGQRKAGGWDHRVDVSHLNREDKALKRNKGNCTFDDKITQGAMEFLIDSDGVMDDKWLDESVELGLAFMLESQFENGAWPQWYPLRGGYHDCYTFNDNAMNDCILLMLKAHEVYGREEYLDSAMRGGDFIIVSQFPVPQAGWAQQYDHDLKPAWARAFEPPGVCTLATVRNIRTLVELYLYTRKDKYLEPIENAIKWLNESMLGEHLWARLYEVQTNREIYGDRMNGNKVFYEYGEISEKERTSYGWRGDYGIEDVIRYYERVKRDGAKAFEKRITQVMSEKKRMRRAQETEEKVREVIGQLDDKGRWVSNETITCEVFVENVRVLLDYVELHGGK